MTKNIFEELPARKHSPAVAAAKSGGTQKKGGESGCLLYTSDAADE